VEEAGGQFSSWAGERTIWTPDVVATNGRLHSLVLRHLAEEEIPIAKS
jgi:histidinol-phosphatase